MVLKSECTIARTRVEFQVYRKLGGIPGISRCHAAYEFKGHGVFVLECFGKNLQYFLRASGGVLAVEKVFQIGREVVRSVPVL